ncbi:Dcm methylase [Serratia nevei]|uniref:Dcm methylase n=1 Tax=Serratia nevei TaxID=2703794 RepID=UPI003F7F5139
MKKAIFIYDFTGLMAQPWIDAGYECWCFDGQHEPGVIREGNHVKVGIWFSASDKLAQAKKITDMVGDGVEIVIGFPECTDLTVAGARHFENKRQVDPLFQLEAAELADLVRIVGLLCDAPWAFENPVGVLSTMYRKPNFSFNPCDFAGYLPEGDIHPVYPEVYPGRDRYNKTTNIWCGGGFIQPPAKRIEPEFKCNPGWKLCGGKSKRTKNIRSTTPRGFARAVFEANACGPCSSCNERYCGNCAHANGVKVQ